MGMLPRFKSSRPDLKIQELAALVRGELFLFEQQ